MTCDNHSYPVIFSDLGSSEVTMKMMKNSKTVNNLKLKDSNISRRFKSDLSHFPLLTEPKPILNVGS